MAIEILNDEESVVRFDAHWDRRIDDLITGACSEEQFLAEVGGLDSSAGDSPWAVVALMDQRFRRGQLAGDTFRAIESRIARRELKLPEGQLTVNISRPPARVITQRIRQMTPEEMELTPPVGDVPLLDAAETPRETLSPGTLLRERYVIKGPVGEGGMGTVYKAIDRFRRDHGEVEWYVAIKVLHERTEGHPEALARLRREFYCAQSLAHRSIVKVYEIDRDGGVDFFTMEYLDGEQLSHIMGPFKWQPLPREAAWSIIRELAEGLAHAHDRNVVHADLKPLNVMITTTGSVRILDFGAASAGHLGQLTPAYASCELLAGQAPDARDDLFALACLAYELLAGTHPFDYKRASEARTLKLEPQRPAGISVRQWRVLQQGLAFDRNERSVSVRDWLNALGIGPSTLKGIPRPQPPPADGTAPETPAARARPPIRLIASALALALVVVLVLLYRRQAPLESRGLPPVVARSVAPPVVAAAPEEETAVPAESAPAGTSAPSAAATEVAAEAPAAPQPKPVRRAPLVPGGTYSVAAPAYRVRSSAKFVEVKVLRTDPTTGASFSWWTEDGSALEGIDYVPQPRTTAFFAPGSRAVTLFIKTAGSEPRREAVNFEVQIGAPSSGGLGSARTQVTLLPGSR